MGPLELFVLEAIVVHLKGMESKMSQISEKLSALEASFGGSLTGISNDITTLIELVNQEPPTDTEALAAIDRLTAIADSFKAVDERFPTQTPPEPTV